MTRQLPAAAESLSDTTSRKGWRHAVPHSMCHMAGGAAAVAWPGPSKKARGASLWRPLRVWKLSVETECGDHDGQAFCRQLQVVAIDLVLEQNSTTVPLASTIFPLLAAHMFKHWVHATVPTPAVTIFLPTDGLIFLINEPPTLPTSSTRLPIATCAPCNSNKQSQDMLLVKAR